MAGDEDQDIFEAGQAPDAAPSPAEAPIDTNEAVSRRISEMQREGRDTGSRYPREVPTPEPAQPAQPRQDGVDDQSPGGLLRAMLDERDRRQGLERQLERYRQAEAEQTRRAKEGETPFDQRFFSQPQQELESFVTQRVQPVEVRMQNMAADFDMRIARMTHGEVFDEAFQTWFQQVGDTSRPDPQTYFRVMNAPSPGEAVMEWFEERKTREEIGGAGGREAYRQKIEQEILAKYGLTGTGEGSPMAPPPGVTQPRQQNGQFTPRHEVRLPSSLSRMGAAGRGNPAAAEDGSEAAIFDAGRPERRR